MYESRVRNDQFDRSKNFERGASALVFMLWYVLKCFVFLSPLPWPSNLKVRCLRLFGAKVGRNVYIKPRVNVHFPWKLRIGDHTWIGEEVCIINFEPVAIGNHCCLSQRATICAGNHDYRDPAMNYRNAPITLNDGVWVGCMAFVGPGLTIGTDAVITAGSIVTNNVEAFSVIRGNPACKIAQRYRDQPKEK